MKDTITSHKFYAVWEYKREEKDLNEASKNGLQLIKGGCFHSTFRRDDSVRYIYQLDFCPKIPDKNRYIECFEDAGWEYVNSTFNGWHYFRRPYTPELSPEDVKIYTDKDSLYMMENRWCAILRACSILTLISGLFMLCYAAYSYAAGRPQGYIFILEAAVLLLISVTFHLAIKNVKRIRAGEQAGFVPSAQILFPLAMILVIFCLILTSFY